MNFIYDKLRRFAEQKAKDDEKLKQDLISRIPEIKETILDTPEIIRNKLETLKEEDKLDLKAIKGLEERLNKLEKSGIDRTTIFGGRRTLGIYESGTVKKKNAQAINFTNATVSDSLGMTTIALSASLETPTGSVNGTNRTFTVLNTPKFITLDGQTLYQNYGYTLSGLTITTDIAPTTIIRSHY
jgi:hypothetical protein